MDYSRSPPRDLGITGVAGSIVGLKRPLIISEIRKNQLFDPNVDLSSLLPILFFPIKSEFIDGFSKG